MGLITQTPDVAQTNPGLGGGGPRVIQLGLKLMFFACFASLSLGGPDSTSANSRPFCPALSLRGARRRGTFASIPSRKLHPNLQLTM